MEDPSSKEDTETTPSTPCTSDQLRKHQKRFAEAALESSTKEMGAAIKDMNKDLSSAVMSMAEAFQATEKKNSEVEESWSNRFETLKSDN